MTTPNYRPGYPLSVFVDSFWFHRQHPSSPLKERILPQGTAEMIFALDTDFFHCHESDSQSLDRFDTEAILTGPHAEFFVTDNTGQGALLGVHFKPGGILPFLDGVSSELYNIKTPLETIWGTSANHLYEQIRAAHSPEQMFKVLERFLTQKLQSNTQLTHLVHTLSILNQRGVAQGVRNLEAYWGLSSRRFRQRFTDLVGLSPKRFEKLRRFNGVLETVVSSNSIDWTSLAVDSGYFDQAHFINDFKAYTGVTPTLYVTHEIRHPNHIPLT